MTYHHQVTRRTPSAPHLKSGHTVSWVRKTFQSRGLIGALDYYLAGLGELVRDLTPSRRKSRYGDIDYDFEHHVDTTWATVSLRTRFRELLSGGQYQPSSPELFHTILQALPESAEGYTFTDLGSGKGRTLLMASDYPFHRIVGVEILDELHDVAVRNIARYRSESQKCFNIASYAGAAQGFMFPDEPMVLYLFNPFSEDVLRTVLDNLRESLNAVPRTVYVIYHNLVMEHVFRERAWLHPLQRTYQYAIYRADPH